MDVFVRGVDKDVVKDFEKLATIRGKSREEMMRTYLNLFQYSNLYQDELNRLELLVQKLERGVSVNRSRVKALEDKTDSLYDLILFATQIE